MCGAGRRAGGGGMYTPPPRVFTAPREGALIQANTIFRESGTKV